MVALCSLGPAPANFPRILRLHHRSAAAGGRVHPILVQRIGRPTLPANKVTLSYQPLPVWCEAQSETRRGEGRHHLSTRPTADRAGLTASCHTHGPGPGHGHGITRTNLNSLLALHCGVDTLPPTDFFPSLLFNLVLIPVQHPVLSLLSPASPPFLPVSVLGHRPSCCILAVDSSALSDSLTRTFSSFPSRSKVIDRLLPQPPRARLHPRRSARIRVCVVS